MPGSPGAPCRLRVAGLLTACLSIGVAGADGPATRPSVPQASCEVTTEDRIVAVGDVHGAHDRFVAILQTAGLLDGDAHWSGGAAVLVQTGDILDRGADSRRALDLLQRLEGEAAEAGGAVHALLGNHEVMRMVNDLRYVSDGEYAAFRSDGSEDLRERLYERRLAGRRRQADEAGESFDEAAFREAFLARTPLGLIEMVLAFGPEGDYGRWLRQRDVMVVINGVAFVHGGTSPSVAMLGCQAINANARTELEALPGGEELTDTLVAGPDGPLWYRGLADAEELDEAAVDGILRALGARALVIGHTPRVDHRIHAGFGDRVFTIDTGMLDGRFYPGGVASALEFRGGTVTAVYEDRREVLVSGASVSPVERRVFADLRHPRARELENRVPPRQE